MKNPMGMLRSIQYTGLCETSGNLCKASFVWWVCSAALIEISARETMGVRHNEIVLLEKMHCWQDATVLLAEKLR
jgi:hypothetical protein